MVNAYQFDKTTKEYKGICPVDTNSLGKAELPFDCTLIKPIKEKKDYAVCFNGNKWQYIRDHRKHFNPITGNFEGGTPYWLPGDTWKSEPRYMITIGELPADALLERPEKPEKEIYKEALLQEKAEKQQWLNEHDYISLKIATGRATIEEYKAEIDQMTVFADRISEINEKLKNLDVNAN